MIVLNQPITRWFFKGDVNANEALDEFLAKDDLKNGHASYIVQDSIDAEIIEKEIQEPKRVIEKPLSKTQQANKLKELVAEDDNPFAKV